MEDFLSLVQNDASIASLLFAKNNGSKRPHRKVLLETCQQLFQNIEGLSKTLHQVDNGNASSSDEPLSGLDELYLQGNDDDNDDEDDAETLWGQVDLQNDALLKLLKKSIKRLEKAAEGEGDTNQIRLLDIEGDIFNQGGDVDEQQGSTDEYESAQEPDDDFDDDDDQEEEDEETRRIRERMERAMEDQEEDDEDDENHESDDQESEGSDDYEDTRFFGKPKTSNKKSNKNDKKPQQNNNINDDENLIDPAAEELNNGFFDINEMEAFADEEEDLLPEEDIFPDLYKPTTKKSNKEKKSFHQRQREGMQEDDDDDMDDDDEEEMERALQTIKRKKYREDDEVEALYKLYEKPDMEDDEEVDTAVNMTAADLFGAPNKKYFHKWKAQQQQQGGEKLNIAAKKEKEDDEDSWDGYDFDQEEADWGDKAMKETARKSKLKSDDKDDSESESEESSDDEDQEVMMLKQDRKDDDKKPSATSQYAKQSAKLREETERLEAEMISEKPWQMVGEASGTKRPVNSLLEGTPEFEVASKQTPAITVQHTADLEEVIKRRILNEDWDDVIPRELPDVSWHKKRGELPEVSQEKAKLGLGELYEREFLKKAVNYDVDAAEKQSEEDKAKDEMRQLFANVCSKLDALSNYHFAPRPIAEEAEVKPATTPAIAMEEVLPLHVSDARAVAPEEVYEKKRGRDGILRSETELEQSERKRIRSSKKAARRKDRKEKAEDAKLISRVQPGLGLNNPYEKRKMREELSMARAAGKLTTGQQDLNQGYGSSGKFFKQMQSEVEKTIRDGRESQDDQDQKKESRSKKSSAFKL